MKDQTECRRHLFLIGTAAARCVHCGAWWMPRQFKWNPPLRPQTWRSA